jgi:hypothetical protein
VIAPAIAEPEYTGVVAATPQPVERAPEPSAPAASPSAPQVAEPVATDEEVAEPVATDEEDGGGLGEAVQSEEVGESPWGDPDRFAESYVSERLKEQFDAEFGGDDKDDSEARKPDWRVDGIPPQPPADVIERYGLELGRKVWMYRQVAWTAGLIKSHLGIGYSNEVSRHLHRLELELALELMNDYGMTLDAKADQEWTSSKRMEKVDLQRKVIAHYDVLIADLEPGKVLGFGIKFIKWVDSVKNRKKRRKIADVWGLNP